MAKEDYNATLIDELVGNVREAPSEGDYNATLIDELLGQDTENIEHTREFNDTVPTKEEAINNRNAVATQAIFGEFVDPAVGYGAGALADRSVRPRVVNALGGQKNATAFRDVLTDASRRQFGGPGAALTRFSTSSMAPRIGGSLLFSQLNPITAAAMATYPELSWQLKQNGLMPDFIGSPGDPAVARHWRQKMENEGTPYIPFPGTRGEPGVEAVLGDAFGRQLPNALDQVGLQPVREYFTDTLPAAVDTLASGDLRSTGLPTWRPAQGALFNNPLSVPGNVWDALPNDWDDWGRMPGLLGF